MDSGKGRSADTIDKDIGPYPRGALRAARQSLINSITHSCSDTLQNVLPRIGIKSKFGIQPTSPPSPLPINPGSQGDLPTGYELCNWNYPGTLTMPDSVDNKESAIDSSSIKQKCGGVKQKQRMTSQSSTLNSEPARKSVVNMLEISHKSSPSSRTVIAPTGRKSTTMETQSAKTEKSLPVIDLTGSNSETETVGLTKNNSNFHRKTKARWEKKRANERQNAPYKTPNSWHAGHPMQYQHSTSNHGQHFHGGVGQDNRFRRHNGFDRANYSSNHAPNNYYHNTHQY